ncbi:MAG: LysR family transcriptional regulator [Proteobacteria bacterium]|nr:LysR family transcriptional regulator [Pseudomonadota bacterium]
MLIELANQGSLSGAARALGVTHVTVSRRIANLEADLGQPMFTREGGRYVLTEQGKRILEIAAPMSSSADAIMRAASGLQANFARPVRITATEAVGLHLVLPGLKIIRTRHPEFEVTFLVSQANLSLAKHDADVAVRLAKPEPGSGIIGSCVARLDYYIYASADYVASREPVDYEYIGYTQEFAGWREAVVLGDIAGNHRCAMRVNHLSNRIEAVRLGIGAALLPDLLADNTPGLVRVSQGRPAMHREVYVLMHEDLQNVPRVRACSEVLIECIRERRARSAA